MGILSDNDMAAEIFWNCVARSHHCKWNEWCHLNHFNFVLRQRVSAHSASQSQCVSDGLCHLCVRLLSRSLEAEMVNASSHRPGIDGSVVFVWGSTQLKWSVQQLTAHPHHRGCDSRASLYWCIVCVCESGSGLRALSCWKCCFNICSTAAAFNIRHCHPRTRILYAPFQHDDDFSWRRKWQIYTDNINTRVSILHSFVGIWNVIYC